MKNTLIRWIVSLLCVVSLFSCADKPGKETLEANLYIKDAPEKAEFEKGETRTWAVYSENVTTIGVTTPAGWAAVCEEELLTVIAPSEESEDIDKEGDIAIIYSGENGEEKQALLSVFLKSVPSESGPSFETKCSEITSVSVKLEVVPSDKEAGYYYDVCTKDAYDRHNGDAGAIVEGIIADFSSQYPVFSMSEILAMLLEHGDSEDDVEGLPSDAEMYFYAVYINEEGKAYGESAVKNFHTLAPGKPEDCTFDFEFESLLSTSVTVKTIPSDPAIRYWTSIEATSEWRGDAAVPVLVKEMIEKYAKENNMSVANVVESVTFTGTHSDPWYDGIEPSTSYYAYAYAMDENGDPAGPVFKQQFTTREYDISDADVEISYHYFDGDELYKADAEKYPDAQGKVMVQVSVTPGETAVGWFVALGKGDMTDDTLYPEESTKSAMMQGGQSNKRLMQYWVSGWEVCTLMAFAMDVYGIDGELYRELIDLKKENASPVEDVISMATSFEMLAPMESSAESKAVIRALRHRL